MTDERKALYRELLYWAMIDIRYNSIQRSFLFNLRHGYSSRKLLRYIRSITQLTHNLAMYSAEDFKDFQEEWFWRDYADFRQKFPANRWAPSVEGIIVQLQQQP